MRWAKLRAEAPPVRNSGKVTGSKESMAMKGTFAISIRLGVRAVTSARRICARQDNQRAKRTAIYERVDRAYKCISSSTPKSGIMYVSEEW